MIQGYLQQIDSLVTNLQEGIRERDKRINELQSLVEDMKEKLDKQTMMSTKRMGKCIDYN